MKTLADLKRDALSGKLSLEMTERYGKTGKDIPERLRGIRKAIKVNSVSIKLQNTDGQESELRFDAAKLVEYDGNTLTIYAAGLRKPNNEEQSVLNECKNVIEQYEKENPYSDSYWKRKDFFKHSVCPWMDGYERIRGKRYQTHDGNVSDYAIRGAAILRYKVYMTA